MTATFSQYVQVLGVSDPEFHFMGGSLHYRGEDTGICVDKIHVFDRGQKVGTFMDPASARIAAMKYYKDSNPAYAEFNITESVNMTESFDELFESVERYHKTSDHAVLTFGRFSPPHKEHTNLVNAVHEHAKKIGGDAHIFVSHSFDKDKNPLKVSEKIAVLRSAHPEHKRSFHAASKESPNIFSSLSDLHKKGYKHATVVLGDDRVDEMKSSLEKYNGKFDKHGRGYHFNSIHVISRHDVHNTRGAAGDDGVHASDVRKAARAGDVDTVKKQLNPKLSHGMVKAIVKRIQQRTSVKEEFLEYFKQSINNKIISESTSHD